jgi:hypothetical protein
VLIFVICRQLWLSAPSICLLGRLPHSEMLPGRTICKSLPSVKQLTICGLPPGAFSGGDLAAPTNALELLMDFSIRHCIGRALVGAAVLPLSACFSFDAKPFELDIPAAQLRIGAQMTSGLGLVAPETPPSLEAADQSVAQAQPETQLIPDQLVSAAGAERPPGEWNADIGDDAFADVDRVVVSGGREASRRVPDYSPDETASLICLMQKIGFDDGNARKAHAATLVARDMRVAMTAGRATKAEIETAERRREDAVQSALSPLPIVDIFFSPIVRKRDLPQPSYKGVNLESITSVSIFENGREVTVVSGVARNTGKSRMEMPPLTLEALDRWDFVLSGQSSLLPFQYLAPGEARSFDIRLLNPPRNTIDVYVHFAPPFRYRWPRDCAFFDSARSTSDGLLGELPASQSRSVWEIIDDQLDAYTLAKTPDLAEGAAANTYSATELNSLTRYFRREAAWAWDCRESTKPECAGADQRLQWRDMFAIAEAADEAWDAVQAFKAVEKAQSETSLTAPAVADADRVRRDAIRSLSGLGEVALRRAGSSVPDIVVEVTASRMKLDQAGLYLEVAGRMNNGASEARRVDALLIALVDRFGLPLSSVTVDATTLLPAGGGEEFLQRIPVRRGGSQPALSTKTAGVIGRAPPEDIPWQIRVGAMGRTTADNGQPSDRGQPSDSSQIRSDE